LVKHAALMTACVFEKSTAKLQTAFLLTVSVALMKSCASGGRNSNTGFSPGQCQGK
jgi:hypothetical protein